MKTIKSIFILIICLSFIFYGCGDSKIIDGTEYDTYGLINQYDMRNEQIQYKPIWGNIIWGVILFETVIAPIYFFGFSMFEPIEKKPAIKGQVVND